MLKRWNLTLVTATFLLSIFGTFLTRSGVIASVHSFTQSSVGWYFLLFLVIAGAFAFALLYTRWPALQPESELEHMASREAAFLFNNLILVGIAFSVLWGTLFPILSELVRGTKITVGPPFFNRVNVPLGLALLTLTGIGPLIAWRRASTANLRRQFVIPVGTGLTALLVLFALGLHDVYGLIALAIAAFVFGTIGQEFIRGMRARGRMYGEGMLSAFTRLIARNRRRYGGYIVHAAIVTYCVAFTGMAFKREQEATLRPGESVAVQSPFGHRYTFTHVSVSQFKEANRYVTEALVRVDRDGKDLGLMSSERRQHFTIEDGAEVKSFEASTEVGIRSDVREDIYIVFAGAVNGTEQAVYRFNINPLVWWVWFGGLLLVTGGLITMWPGGPQVAPLRRGPLVQPEAGEVGAHV